MGNLEPIEEGDLDLKNKFTGEGGGAGGSEVENKTEKPDFVLEKLPENRQEGAVEKESAYTKILSKVQAPAQPAADDQVVAADAQSIGSSDAEESKIETLIKLATTKGVVHAVKVARHLEDNFALDEFHDRLLGEELHDALLKKGLIKEL